MKASNPSTNSEIYDPGTGAWASGGSTGNTLTDPLLNEIGPALLRPDGSVFALGSSGNSAIYNTRKHRWFTGTTLPLSPQGFHYTVQDGPGALLPSGHVLVAASGGSLGSAFGDEVQDATHYPLLRITNLGTHHVFYSRTHDHSSMAVASEHETSTVFDVSATQEPGLSRLEVVAHGVASEPVTVYVRK